VRVMEARELLLPWMPPQHTATHRNTLQHATTHYTCGATSESDEGHSCSCSRECHRNTPQHTATHCDATHCNTLQHTATHCNTSQHAATRCNILHLRCDRRE